ncbi:ADP-dependent (S)-NAD(P)H-hydrate dehydratase [Nitrosotalea sinensis]|uniref:ADP-dependent (S)-NAD(P)H-hydrate dehydratase n=1 Tax=Nitrosotalea sinensis TaxID=1499975 RepID=A0A2H1EJD5_9ARCH|nr:NAD(P)H-hydrate dehydratase [Candidatus Nitrosotalea sinensis]SHO47358.1 ADP-dependent (S)-NAD(P)H-hydrate dehydratase [Candidatus Nitrosotalea sinensis]
MRKILQPTIVKNFIPSRNVYSRKGDNGKVLVLGGNYLYHGAPILSSIAALRSGTDLVYTCVPKMNVEPTRAYSPNLIVIPIVDAKLTRGAVQKLLGIIPTGIDSATIGMGLGIQDKEALKILVSSLLDRAVMVSLDASALIPEILDSIRGKKVIVTPHAGEFKRLFGEMPFDDVKQRSLMVEKYAKEYDVTILLKGPIDIVSDGKITYLNPKNIAAMTVGGTGDVLSGVVAAMLSKNKNPVQAAAAAAYVNGKAGLFAQKKYGLHIVATDLLDFIPSAIKPFDKVRK